MEWKKEAPPGSIHAARVPLRMIVPQGVTLEDLQKPSWWRCNSETAGHSDHYNGSGWNKIEVICEDGSWEAEIRVVAVIGNDVHIRVLNEWQETGRQQKAPDNYKIEHLHNYGWRAVGPRGDIIKDNMPLRWMAVEAAVADARK